MKDTGFFLVVDAIDGAGKTTALGFIEQWAQKTFGSDCVVRTREPGGTPLAEKLREILLVPTSEVINAEAESLIVNAARSLHLENLIKPSLAKGKIVISDRYHSSTFAYQGTAGQVDIGELEWLDRFVAKGMSPDAYIILDLPPEVSLKRASDRSEPDRLEQNDLEYFKRVRKGFLDFAERHKDKTYIVDATQSIEDVQLSLSKVLDAVFSEKIRELSVEEPPAVGL